MSRSSHLVHQVTDATVRVTGKRWCTSCCVFHPADQMTPRKNSAGGVVYRCPKWFEAHAKRKAPALC